KVHKNHLPERVWSRARPVGNRRTAVSRASVDLVIRDAGHQTSLFSIRPPEVLQRSSLEGASTKPRSMPSRADSRRLVSATQVVVAVPPDRLAIAALW